jgi:periplasmic protein TonB
MFSDVVDPSISVGSSRGYTVPLSIAAHTIVIGALIIVPLAAVGVLPTPASRLIIFDSIPALPAPPPVAPARGPVATTAPTTNPSAAPVVAPPDIRPEPDVQPRTRVVGEIELGAGDVPAGLFQPTAPPPPPPPPVRPAVPQAPVRPGGNIQQPVRVKDVPPVYPQLAQIARIQGVVIIEATIDVNGRVQDARVLRSIPQLDAAAVDAVRQWQYTPTLLNGMPVPVIITVTVNFRLN